MKTALLLGVLVVALTSCGETDGTAGRSACETYRRAVSDAPEATADTVALSEIKGNLSDLDDPTRRAFADLITAADTNPFLPGADPTAVDGAAATVRSVCLSEHGVEIEN